MYEGFFFNLREQNEFHTKSCVQTGLLFDIITVQIQAFTLAVNQFEISSSENVAAKYVRHKYVGIIFFKLLFSLEALARLLYSTSD